MPGLLSLKLDKIAFRGLANKVQEFRALSKAQVDWRLDKGQNIRTKDLFAYLIEAKDPETGERLTEEQVIAETGSLLLAGSDTQATALAATLFYCLHYTTALNKLQNEIRNVFNKVEDIRIGKQLTSCRYLRACIDEAMRLTPPVGTLLRRQVLSGGLNVDGEAIPAGVDIGVPHYAIHHNKGYFPEPFTFVPERWIAGARQNNGIITSEQSVSLAQSAFCAFGVGRTSCIGKSLAYTEMSIILARIIWLFDVRLQPGSMLGQGHPRLGKSRSLTTEFQTCDGFFSSHDGPMVEFMARERTSNTV